jgi:hypothetical protein
MSTIPIFLAKAAAAFIRALPSSMIQPEVAVDPDGQVSHEWFGAKDRIFLISFGEPHAWRLQAVGTESHPLRALDA